MGYTDDECGLALQGIDHSIVANSKLVKAFKRSAQRKRTQVGGVQLFFDSVDYSRCNLPVQPAQIASYR